ncbi:MAG: hypothetical protein A2268_12415 [Candidatus Raymondbacteria bacterium RifOxyA12_full_50_37]|uniref:Hydrogenase n=1 Tax=Candidatus Raymondbacteria bacterium RIFOXYD12_FULL_49_13 TaxID=1817890 RepID=A0A1F7F8E9_UNCRA|nr:MAG: hypothetical protein A2268_12415 [Candidatus Raymondbacteria bacterium RifOxyA12_full_50_37]OGJ91342.1 MAG: hypothetical protein A2248_03910 [Candidatus Raymondbacteria bacterium RIFOXYA2_FULL_49_16]OGJ91564.1 MAG: hypothetical protein A2350_11790 [Candidatus Raymondbacteria bacterium RifOxyB12_full_50_8]OGJ97753.1 MAG: hypothetical protein A2453_13810 [Candidatus Raymondbacteria bacterium RIFOXYC2_FULL_50_21]OGK00145.1 MAG: hypothetical protein A2487_09520 [Candidatus Raymondbacteria b
METYIEASVILLLLTDIALFGTSRLYTCITIAAVQGVLLGLIALFANAETFIPRIIVIASIGIVIKAFVFPYLLKRTIRQAGVQREIQPFIGYLSSLVVSLVLFGVSIWFSAKLPLALGAGRSMIIPAAIMTMFTGLFLIVARRKALTQCIGYIVCENGMYLFGMVAVGEIPALVELGILLDAVAAVTVMGVAMYHINREFDHIDTDRLSSLKG